MKPKTICILSYQRTGSSWLSDILSGSNTINGGEIFCKDPLQFAPTVISILSKIYNINPSIINTLHKIYSISNFFVNPNNYIQIKNNILAKQPYSAELLYEMQNLVYTHGYSFVFKIFRNHLDSANLLDILNISDYIIVNYRNNLLDSFISEQKSFISQRWTSTQTNRKYLEKIQWYENIYKKYVDKTILDLNYFVENINKPYVMLAYEDIHKSNNKVEFIRSKMKHIYPDFVWDFKTTSVFQKENYINQIENNFLNKEEFLQSYKNLDRIYIYE